MNEQGVQKSTIKTHSCASREEAEAQKQQWKKELPAVKSAYQPSGKLPAKALWLMIVGAFLGVPAGALAGGAALGIGSIISLLCLAFLKFISESCKVVWCLPIVILFLVVIITFFGMYAVIGFAASGLIVAMGKAGKNRNTTVTMTISTISALAAVIPFWLAASSFSNSLENRDLEQAFSLVFSSQGFGLVCLIVGLIVAAVSAALASREMVTTAKFCEACDLYMKSKVLSQLTFENAKELVKHIASGMISEIPKLLQPLPEGEGSVSLYSCPACGTGFIEATISYAAQWQDKKNNTETTSDSWMIASKPLSPGEVSNFNELRKPDAPSS